MRSYIYIHTTCIAVSYMYIYYTHVCIYLLYALVHASAAETIRWWSVAAAAAAAEMPRAHIIHCVCVCARARVVHASIGHHVDLLKNSLYLVATIFGGVESRWEKQLWKKKNQIYIYINILTSFRRVHSIYVFYVYIIYIHIKRASCDDVAVYIYRHRSV